MYIVTVTAFSESVESVHKYSKHSITTVVNQQSVYDVILVTNRITWHCRHSHKAVMEKSHLEIQSQLSHREKPAPLPPAMSLNTVWKYS